MAHNPDRPVRNVQPSVRLRDSLDIVQTGRGLPVKADLEAATARDEQEFQDYLQAPRISAANDPLEWWKANRTRFPTLFPMAKSFLGCPATTAELERVFSKAGKLHDDQRKSVLDVTLEQQLFAAFSWKCRVAFRCVLLSRPTTPPPT